MHFEGRDCQERLCEGSRGTPDASTSILELDQLGRKWIYAGMSYYWHIVNPDGVSPWNGGTGNQFTTDVNSSSSCNGFTGTDYQGWVVLNEEMHTLQAGPSLGDFSRHTIRDRESVFRKNHHLRYLVSRSDRCVPSRGLASPLFLAGNGLWAFAVDRGPRDE